jgi:hypothetical protein
LNQKNCYILGIESSCDDTAAAVINNAEILSNVVATQAIHEQYGGVVPELASRAHQQNIVPVVHQALQRANIDKKTVICHRFYTRTWSYGFVARRRLIFKIFGARTGHSVDRCKPHAGAYFSSFY